MSESILAARESPKKILEILSAAGFGVETLRGLLPEPAFPFPYSRKILIATSECEIMVARWAKDRACAPHDHGSSAGWVFFLEGRFHEVEYHWNGEALVEDRPIVREPATFGAVQADEVHSCRCESAGLSLHLYFPRIRAMRVYDLAQRRTLIVSDECGAWVPIESVHTLKVIPWSSATPIAAS